MDVTDKYQCNQCISSFKRRGGLNRHLRNIHKENPEPQINKKCHIKCNICSLDLVVKMFFTYKDYNKHLEDMHKIIVQRSNWLFGTKEDFDVWHEADKRNVRYTYQTGSCTQSSKIMYYNCNRSDTKGFESKNIKNNIKTGGSIKIQGACPSRFIAKFNTNGQVALDFFETHVGHTEEVRAQQLTKKEQIYLVNQLKKGISTEKIIANARNYNLPNSGSPGRINCITSDDIFNLRRRYNVENIHRRKKLIQQRKRTNRDLKLLKTELKTMKMDLQKSLRVTTRDQFIQSFIEYIKQTEEEKTTAGDAGLVQNEHIRIEKILNSVQEVVEAKIWKRIMAMLRLNKKSNVARKIVKVHRKALSSSDNTNNKAVSIVKTGNKMVKIQKSSMTTPESPMETTDSHRRQIFRDHCVNLVDSMCHTDENTYNIFVGFMNSVEGKIHQLKHATNDNRNTIENHKPVLRGRKAPLNI